MQIELSLEEIDFLQSVLNGAEKSPINYAIFKKLGAAYECGSRCSCGSPSFYTDKVFGVVCCQCQAPLARKASYG